MNRILKFFNGISGKIKGNPLASKLKEAMKSRFKWHYIAITPFAIIFILITTSVIFEIVSSDKITFKLCLSDECLVFFNSHFGQRMNFLLETFKISALILGFISAHVALESYKLSQKNSKLNNHILNFNSFCTYVDFELSKKPHLDARSLNKHTLYNVLFPESRKGNLDNYDIYITGVNRIADSIIKSSEYYTTARGIQEQSKVKGFDHNKHQDSIINSFIPLGIKMTRLLKNDFFNVETDWISFIDAVTETFAYDTDIKRLTFLERTYI